MRPRRLPPVLLILGAAGAWHLASPAALAQVSVDQGALDSLQPRPGTSPAPRRPQAPVQPAQPQSQSLPRAARPGALPGSGEVAAPQPAQPQGRQAARPQPPQRAAPPPAVPPAAPPVAVVAPPSPVPPTRPVPAPPVPVVDGAPGEATRVGSALRVTFGPGSSDLNRATEAALRELARAVRDDERLNVAVTAYAAGQPDDPSTPRRISLARVLAARAVLLSEGIASTRILPRALGPNVPDGPADRVDLVPTPGGSATMPSPAVAGGPPGRVPGQAAR